VAKPTTGGPVPHPPACAPAEPGPGGDETDGPSSLPVYLVTLDTPQGRAELEVPTLLGPAAAERRAWRTAVQRRWGDVDEITVVSTELMAEELPR
jgi:hypothetical protein